MRGKSLLMLAVLASAFLAGCSDVKKATDTEPTDELGLEATDDTGIIRGIVIDSSVRPLMDVAISLVVPNADDLTTKTTAAGAFGFEGLAPGTYFLRAQRTGYVTTQQSVEVIAGDDSPPMTRILLDRDPEAIAPFAVTYVFEGFLECSTPLVAVCFAVNQYLDNATQEKSQVRYQLDGSPMWVQSEMVWDPTNELGHRLGLYYSYDCNDPIYYCDFTAYGESPLLLTADEEKVETLGLANGTELYIRVFSEGLEETAGLAGATLEQDITIYTTVFYGYVPPEGWRFSVESEEPVPPE